MRSFEHWRELSFEEAKADLLAELFPIAPAATSGSATKPPAGGASGAGRVSSEAGRVSGDAGSGARREGTI